MAIPRCVGCGTRRQEQVIAELWHWPEGPWGGPFFGEYMARGMRHLCSDCEAHTVSIMYVYEDKYHPGVQHLSTGDNIYPRIPMHRGEAARTAWYR